VDGGAGFLRGPVGRGQLLVATLKGQISVRDPRAADFRPQCSMETHSAGLTSLSVHGDLVATSGLTPRHGKVVPENVVRIYDARMSLRPLSSIPTPLCAPTAVHFDTSSRIARLFAAGTDRFRGCGIVYLLNGGLGTVTATQAVEVGAGSPPHDPSGPPPPPSSAAITDIAVSSSGHVLGIADSGGCVRLYSVEESEPVLNYESEPLEPAPPVRPKPAMKMTEFDSFSRVPVHESADGTRLSDYDPEDTMPVGLPPRIIDPSIKKALKPAADGGTLFAPNPFFARGAPKGEAARKSVGIRSARAAAPAATAGADIVRQKEQRRRERVEAGLPVLPDTFRRCAEFIFSSIPRRRTLLFFTSLLSYSVRVLCVLRFPANVFSSLYLNSL
jgi:PAB-dependent poly(A)-specific ribonuclease subunit 2